MSIIDKEKVLKSDQEWEMNITIFLCMLVLHFASVYTVRHGITMCKYALFHRDEFENPNSAFMLGFAITIINMFC